MNVTDIQNAINLSLPIPLKTYKGNYDICGIRNGYGKQNWRKTWSQDYQGLFYNDCLHTHGTYQWEYEKEKYNYDGKIYANNIEGYGYKTYPDGSSYEGLFRNNERFGPGVFTYPDGSQDVGLWNTSNLVRLSEELSECVPVLARTLPAKVQLAQYKKIVSVVPPKPTTEKVLNEFNASNNVQNQRHQLCNPFIRNPNSLFFDKENFNKRYFSDEIQIVDVVTSFKNGTPVLQKKSVDELLAWNNEEESIQVMKHTFLHRNYENNLTFNVSSILVGERDDFRNAGVLENACLEFLEASCKGHNKKMSHLITKFDINPDMCDLAGNTAIHCAASKDEHQAIKVLVNFGANLDRVNDEELTPLTIDLLRYIAKKEDVTDWEKAFLPPKEETQRISETQQIHFEIKQPPSHDQWRSKLSLKSSPTLSGTMKKTQAYILDIKCKVPAKNSKLKMFSSVRFDKSNTKAVSSRNLEKKSKVSNEKSVSKQNLESKSNLKSKSKDLKGKSEGKSKKRVGKKESRISKLKSTLSPTPAEMEADRLKAEKKQELSKIHETILLLLHYGADPNYGIVPLPPLILAIFAQEDELLQHLIDRGADCNITTAYQDGSLTPLHIITALQPDAQSVNVAHILLKHGANPNARANAEHWLEEKKKIDPENQCDDEGKTPLHLLCMRYDYDEDEEDILGLLYDTIVQNEGDPTLYYLGHTCLTLAMIRGNINLVKRILSSYEVDPNQFLGCNMGVPLTVLILKRYKYILQVDKVQTIYELLEEYNANPFNALPNFEGNAIEFCEEENQLIGSVPKKNDPHLNVIQCLTDVAKHVLERHIETKAVRYIYEYKIECDIDDVIFEAMAKFVDLEDTLRILQVLINYDLIHNNHVAMYSLLKFIYRKSANQKGYHRGRSVKGSPLKGKLEDIVCNLVKEEKPFKKIDVPLPEVDTDEEKFKVCFHCYKKTNKTLVLCPTCELVYFCSEICNKNNIKSYTRHKCKGVFYNSELKRMRERLLRGSALGTTMDRFKKIRDDYFADPNNEFNIKYAFSSVLGISFGDDQKKKKGKKGSERSGSKSKSRSKSGAKGKKKRDKSKSTRGKSRGKSKGKSKDRSRAKSKGKGKSKDKDRSRGKSKEKSSDRTRGRSKGKSDRSKSPKGGKSRSPSQEAKHKAEMDKAKAKGTLSRTGDHLTEREKQGIALLGDKYKLMSDMSGLLDILLMNKRFWPCCILVNGQLFYKFGEMTAYCSINYSHV